MRMDCKKEAIEQLLNITQNSWEPAFYITLAHNFGFHINGVAFEQLAIQTPLSCLQKHKNSLFQLTAILLGQSGLLTAENAEDNRITRQWKLLGQELHTAADSQALIHLFQHFCQKEKCLNCEIGYQIFLDHMFAK